MDFFFSNLFIWNQDNVQVLFVLDSWKFYHLLFMFSLLYTCKRWWRTNVMSSDIFFLISAKVLFGIYTFSHLGLAIFFFLHNKLKR